MPVYTLPSTPAMAAALASGRAREVADRVASFAAHRSYRIGAGGIQVHRDGAVTIDADRDPSADWAAFDPAVPTAAEAEDATRLDQLLADMETGTTAQAIAALRVMVPRLVRRAPPEGVSAATRLQGVPVATLPQGVKGEENDEVLLRAPLPLSAATPPEAKPTPPEQRGTR
jgi:hypothetical protein